MIDEETETLWSHLLGEAMDGPLVGEVLDIVPTIVTDWETWRRHYPDSSLAMMARSTTRYRRDFHTEDGGLLLGLVEKGKARAWSFGDLYDHSVINDEFGGRFILVVFGRRAGTAALYDRTLDGQVLEFERRNGRVTDLQTGSEWDAISGVGLTGPLVGKKLDRLSGILSDAAVWSLYHFDCEYWQKESSPPTTPDGEPTDASKPPNVEANGP